MKSIMCYLNKSTIKVMNIMITVVQNYSFTEIIAGISIIIDFAKLILFEVGVVI